MEWCTWFEVSAILLAAASASRGEESAEATAADAARGSLAALVGADGARRCSATAITPRWLVTAAHCLRGRLPTHARTAGGALVPLAQCYVHRRANSERDPARGVLKLRDDIGLVMTESDLQSVVAPVWLDDPGVRAGDRVTVYGFGRNGSESFSVGMMVTGCMCRGWERVTCGGTAEDAKRPLCGGDSGDPVWLRDGVYAVLSMGTRSCRATPPLTVSGVFTPLHHYRKEILAKVEGDGDGDGGEEGDGDGMWSMRLVRSAGGSRTVRSLLLLLLCGALLYACSVVCSL